MGDERNGYTQIIPVFPLKTYVFRLWAKGVNGGEAGRLQINWLNIERKMMDVFVKVFTATPMFVQYSARVTVPSGAAFAEIYVSSSTEHDKIWYDDYSLVKE